mgnify:FL=1
MNSSKKIMNKQNSESAKAPSQASAAKGNKRLSDGGLSDTKKIVIGAICVIIVLVLCIGVGIQQFQPKVVLKVNNTKLTMDDMMYPIYERESAYLPYNEMYQMYTGKSIWENNYMGSDRNITSTVTNAIGIKQEVIDTETEYEILYQEAKKAGYKLSADDKKDVQEEVSKALKGLSFTQKLRLNISKGKLTKRFERRKLADNYKDAETKELDKTVDEKAAVKDISKKDYREYKVQCYAFSNTTTDSDGNTKKLSDSEKSKLGKELQALYKKAADAKDFSNLLKDDSKSDIKFSDTSFTEKDGWSMVTDKKLLKQIKAMKKGEISEVIKDEKSGYVLFVKMVDNNSQDSYKKACDSAVESAQNDAYDKWYQGILENYKVSTNSDVWEDVTIGSVTTDIVTAADLEKMNKDSSDATSGK